MGDNLLQPPGVSRDPHRGADAAESDPRLGEPRGEGVGQAAGHRGEVNRLLLEEQARTLRVGQPRKIINAPGQALGLCHLCGHARSVLATLSLPAREVDVQSPEAEALAARGVPLAFLPVLWDGEEVLAYGHFSERRLRRDLSL